MNRSTADSGRQRRRYSRIAALRLIALSAVSWLLLVAASNAATVRQIFESVTPFNDGLFYMDQ